MMLKTYSCYKFKICLVYFDQDQVLLLLNLYLLSNALNHIGYPTSVVSLNDTHAMLNADVVVVYRPVNSYVSLLPILGQRMLFVCIDDNMFCTGPGCGEYSENFIKWGEDADGFIVPNKEIADLIPFRKPVVIRETGFSNEIYSILAKHVPSKDVFNIGYTGYIGRIAQTLPILYEMAKKLNNLDFNYQLVFFSTSSHAYKDIINCCKTKIHSFIPLAAGTAYYEAVSSLELNVMINPLTINLVTCAKSPLKFAEAAGLGIPIISSPIDSYVEIIEHGKNGFLANSADEFIRIIRFVKNNDSTQIVKNAREVALSRLSVENQVEKFVRDIDLVKHGLKNKSLHNIL